jgi:hypothetical protein
MGRPRIVWRGDEGETLTNLLRSLVAGFDGTLYELEARSGIPRSQLGRFRNGRGGLTARSVGMLLRAFDLQILERRGRRRAQRLTD